MNEELLPMIPSAPVGEPVVAQVPENIEKEPTLSEYLQKGIDGGKKWLMLKAQVENLSNPAGLEQILKERMRVGQVTPEEAGEIKRLYSVSKPVVENKPVSPEVQPTEVVVEESKQEKVEVQVSAEVAPVDVVSQPAEVVPAPPTATDIAPPPAEETLPPVQVEVVPEKTENVLQNALSKNKEPLDIPSDPYEILGVPHNTSRNQIKEAFKKKSAPYREALNPGNVEAATWFSALETARDILLAKVGGEDIPESSEVNEENKEEKNDELKEDKHASEEKNPEEIETELLSARLNYAKVFKEWKNENRKKKGLINRVKRTADDLGLGGETKEEDKSEELKEAEEAYRDAKKKKNETLFDQSETRTRILKGDGRVGRAVISLGNKVFKEKRRPFEDRTVEYQFNQAALDEAEKEYALLQKEMENGQPPLEKGIAGKALEMWTKMSPLKRRLLSAGLLTVGTAVVGGMALPVAAATFASKVVRSAVGATAGGMAGKTYSMAANVNNEKIHTSNLKEYGTNMYAESFERKDRELMAAREKEANKKKRDILKKAGIMLVAGGAANAGFGAFQHSLLHGADVPHVGGSGAVEADHHVDVPHRGGTIAGSDLAAPRPASSFEEHIASAKGLNTEVKMTIEDVPPVKQSIELPEVKTELSSRGFIQTFDDLKHNLVEKYGEGKVPEQYEHLMKTPSTKLAQEFGFYDPEKHLSAVAFKGEDLVLDSKGNLVYHDMSHDNPILMNAETGARMKLTIDNMKNYDLPKPLPDHLDATQLETEPHVSTDNVPDADQNYYEQESPVEVQPEVESLAPEVSPVEAVAETPLPPGAPHPYLDMLTEGSDGKVLKIGGQAGVEIAHEHIFSNQKLLVLEDQFQDGKQYADVRKFFSSTLSEYIQDKKLGAGVTPIAFENGTIHIVQGLPGNPAGVEVLLNGKEIAKGAFQGGAAKVEVLKDLKGGFLRAETVYERAFKEANKIIKNLKVS